VALGLNCTIGCWAFAWWCQARSVIFGDEMWLRLTVYWNTQTTTMVILKNPHQLYECPLYGIKIAVWWTVTPQFFNETQSYRCYMNLILSPFFSELLK